jgi:hypothetical protein
MRSPTRRCDMARRWPEDVAGDPHVTGMILSAALWEVRAAAVHARGLADGRSAADRLVLGALRYLAPRNNDPRDLLDALLQADRRLETALGDAIVAAFAAHGVRTTR